MLQPEFKTIKQPCGSKVCGAAVTAMAIGCSLEEAQAQMTPSYHEGDPYYKTREVLKVLGSHGIFTGMIFSVADGHLWHNADIKFDFKFNEIIAIVVVKSNTYEGKSHFVFWDGSCVRDPSLAVGFCTSIEEYEVEEIYPLVYIDESFEC